MGVIDWLLEGDPAIRWQVGDSGRAVQTAAVIELGAAIAPTEG